MRSCEGFVLLFALVAMNASSSYLAGVDGVDGGGARLGWWVEELLFSKWNLISVGRVEP